jgi:hypothetical protein
MIPDGEDKSMTNCRSLSIRSLSHLHLSENIPRGADEGGEFWACCIASMQHSRGRNGVSPVYTIINKTYTRRQQSNKKKAWPDAGKEKTSENRRQARGRGMRSSAVCNA